MNCFCCNNSLIHASCANSNLSCTDYYCIIDEICNTEEGSYILLNFSKTKSIDNAKGFCITSMNYDEANAYYIDDHYTEKYPEIELNKYYNVVTLKSMEECINYIKTLEENLLLA